MAEAFELTTILPRYLRVQGNLSAWTNDHLKSFIADLKKKSGISCIYPVRWLPGYLAIPSYCRVMNLVHGIKPIEMGVYPMDVSSGVPTALLELQHADRVLDLCCCPGGKLLAMADLCKPTSTVMGVDVSERRIDVCKSLLRQSLTYLNTHSHTADAGSDTSPGPSPYTAPRLILVHGDGCTFGSSPCPVTTDKSSAEVEDKVNVNVVFDSSVFALDLFERGDRKRMNKSARQRERKRIRLSTTIATPTTISPSSSISDDTGIGYREKNPDEKNKNTNKDQDKSWLFDKFDAVLVDAQCTHDGSYKHMGFMQVQSQSQSHQTATAEIPVVDVDGGVGVGDGQIGSARADKKKRLAAVTADNTSTMDHKDQFLELQGLQRSLLSNGFSQTRPGGMLVYSTCSVQSSQDEDVVSWLLETYPDASLVSIPTVWKTCQTRTYGSEVIAVWEQISQFVSQSSDVTTSAAAVDFPLPSEGRMDTTTTSNPLFNIVAQLGIRLGQESGSVSESESSLTGTAEHKKTADELCRAVAGAESPPLEESDILPGTVRLSYKGGVSGLFVARIHKRQ
eukprot:gene6349-12840_t